MSIDHHLTLRVTIRDEAACAAITPEQANAYLAAHGWTLTRTTPTWHVHHLGNAELLVPRFTGFADYGQCMCSLVNRLAESENRSALAVYVDLASAAGSD
jgi:hypothetical protein